MKSKLQMRLAKRRREDFKYLTRMVLLAGIQAVILAGLATALLALGLKLLR